MSAKSIIVELQRSSVTFSHLHKRRGEWVVDKSWKSTWNDGEIPWDQEGEVANWLSASLVNAKVRADAAIVCVPRSSVCFRVLELPEVSERQMAQLVAMQVEALFGDQARDTEYDFLPVAGSQRDGKQSVLLLTIAKPLVQSIQNVVGLVGWKLQGLTVSELALGYHDELGREGLSHVLAVRADQMDVAVCLGGLPLQMQSHLIEQDDRDRRMVTAGLLQRVQASLPASLRQLPVKSKIFLQEDSQTQSLLLSNFVADEREWRVLTEPRIVAIPRMTQQSSRGIDFSNPFRAIDRRVLARRRLVRIGVLLACLAGAGFASLSWYTRKLKEQVAIAENKIVDLEAELAHLAPEVEAQQRVAEWQQKQVGWNEELTGLAYRIGKKQSLYLARMQMEAADSEQAPLIRLDGLAKSSEAVLELNREFLLEPGRYSIQPHTIEPAVADNDFPAQFRLEARVLMRASAEKLNPNLDLEATSAEGSREDE